MSVKPTIIYFNVGNPDFLFYTLKQARETNPDARIVLLGDDTNNQYDFVEHHNINKYSANADKFKQVYSHMSTNNEQFEFICFARWYIINDFVKEQGIESFFYSDSDVLLFCDIKDELEKFRNYRYTLTHNISAGIAFFLDVSVLEEYCELCTNVFTRKEPFYFDKCFSHYLNLQKNNRMGGVCDMTIWEIHRNMDNPGDIGETSAIIEESTFDHNINQSYGYEVQGGTKRFVFENGVPYSRHLRTNRMIKFNCIHYQGVGAKALIRRDYQKCQT